MEHGMRPGSNAGMFGVRILPPLPELVLFGGEVRWFSLAEPRFTAGYFSSEPPARAFK